MASATDREVGTDRKVGLMVRTYNGHIKFINEDMEMDNSDSNIHWYANATNARRSAARLKRLHPTARFFPYYPNKRSGFIAF